MNARSRLTVDSQLGASGVASFAGSIRHVWIADAVDRALSLAADPQPAQPAFTPHSRGFSLLTGSIPLAVQLAAVALLLVVIGWRSRRWRLLWLPICVAVGVVSGVAGVYYVRYQGLESDPPPDTLWLWLGGLGVAVAVAVLGFRTARWWRRALSIPAIVLVAAATLVVLNQWVGYFPTVQTAWQALTAGPLPDSVDAADLPSLRNTSMDTGKVVEIDTGDAASGFRHRSEYVYLPPAWFAGDQPPSLPAIMMVGGEFNTPADWIRSGDVIDVVDAYAASHDGVAPILVFVDAGGTFNNDTECVDGPRGNSHEHLVDDVRPYVVDHFGVSAQASAWGVVGFSMGGTCAIDLAVMQPDKFAAFEDIAGDIGPAAGTKDQTIDRLYGGDAAKWDDFDPQTVMNTHGPYTQLAGWFADPGPQPTPQRSRTPRRRSRRDGWRRFQPRPGRSDSPRNPVHRSRSRRHRLPDPHRRRTPQLAIRRGFVRRSTPLVHDDAPLIERGVASSQGRCRSIGGYRRPK